MNGFFVGGFIRKCMEFGVGPYEAGALMKLAQAGVAPPPVPGPNQQVQPGAGTAWQPPQWLSPHQTGQYNNWSRMSVEQQYQLLQEANPTQKQILRQWTPPERQAELRGIHAQNRRMAEYDGYRQRTGAYHPDDPRRQASMSGRAANAPKMPGRQTVSAATGVRTGTVAGPQAISRGNSSVKADFEGERYFDNYKDPNYRPPVKIPAAPSGRNTAQNAGSGLVSASNPRPERGWRAPFARSRWS